MIAEAEIESLKVKNPANTTIGSLAREVESQRRTIKSLKAEVEHQQKVNNRIKGEVGILKNAFNALGSLIKSAANEIGA